MAAQLQEQVGRGFHEFKFFVNEEHDGGARGHYFRFQVAEAAKQLEYYANLGEYHGWIRLVLKGAGQAEVLVSFHGLGTEYRGLLAASMCFFRREATDHEERQITDLLSPAEGVFQVNYREPTTQAQGRFREWLETGLVRSLEMWRATL